MYKHLAHYETCYTLKSLCLGVWLESVKMNKILGVVITFSGLLMLSPAVPVELIEDIVNCTKIGVATDCCETHGCAFINCTDGLKCVSAHNVSSWGDTCETAANQCIEVLLGNGTTPIPGFNDTTIIPQTTPYDNSTNSTSTPVTMPTTSVHGNITSNDSTPTEAITTATVPVRQLTNNTSSSPQSKQDAAACSRQFDTASFVGGMVFMLGIVAIGGFIYMYCRSQGNTNYRLL